MRARKIAFLLSSISAAAVIAGVAYYATSGPVPPASLSPEQSRRYVEIHRLIRDNLHFSAHMTWAVNVPTIAAARQHITTRDIPVLAAMIADERAAVGFGAASLLVTLGDAAVPALRRVAKSPDFSISHRASDALQTIKRCRDPKETMSREVCPAARR